MKYLLFTIGQLLFISNIFTQSYNIATYNGLTVNTCSGNFYDSGGSGGNYGNNENYVVTFCSSSGSPLYFDFGASSSSLNLDAGTGDTLFFYDGLTTSDPLIATLTKSDDYGFSNPTVGTVSTCVTVQWKSNGSAADGGWSATIDCTEPPVCADNPPAADVFGQATAVCNLNDYCGTTSGYYGEDAPYNFGGTGGSCPHPDDDLFAGTLENNSWLKFIAAATTSTFDFNVTGGASCDGVQIGIYAFNEATKTFTLKSPCSYTDGGHEGVFSITASSLVVGDTYYMMIDGNSGSNCDYTIGANTGVATVDAGPDQSICGASVTLNAETVTGTGTWSLVSGSGSFDDATNPDAWVSGLALGENVFQWTTTDGLCGDGFDVVTVNNICLLPIHITNFYGETSQEGVHLFWTSATNNLDYFTIEKSIDGVHFFAIGKVQYTTNGNYTFIDENPAMNENYYRLIQVDYSGESYESQVIVIQYAAHLYNLYEQHMYLNQEGNLIIPGTFQHDATVTLQIFDILGKMVFTHQENVSSNMALTEIQLSNTTLKGVMLCAVNVNGIAYAAQLLVMD